MKYLLALSDINPSDRAWVGGKGYALARLVSHGFQVPKTFCLITAAYNEYLDAAGVRERILMELNRKDFQKMRWEEMWDASLRIRHLFLTTPMPDKMHQELVDCLDHHFAGQAVVVRSSAPAEDSSRSSFAGLHESFVNVIGTAAILQHIRLVWASLWSDAALLYRQELKLAGSTSAMGVVIQELVPGDASGVAFSCNPSNEAQAVIEAVYGLNQGLVDGVIEPDRWLIDRSTGAVHHFPPTARLSWYQPEGESVILKDLPGTLAARPPLAPEQVLRVYETALQAEAAFAAPQDVEWTISRDVFTVLQARPITTVATADRDQRSWYLSLRRSYENLKSLRHRLENDLLPAMAAAAAKLQQQELQALDDAALAQELSRRQEIYDHWLGVYWRDFIPFAHGMRLFGQLYNDTLRPEDPFEFMNLLGGAPLLSLKRNRRLAEMAEKVRHDPKLAAAVRHHDLSALEPGFRQLLDEFLHTYGDLSCPATGAQCRQGPEAILQVVSEMAGHPPRALARASADGAALTQKFLSHFSGEKKTEAAGILDLARTSYRLRDDDNIHLGRLAAEKTKALQEAWERLARRGLKLPDNLPPAEMSKALLDPRYQPESNDQPVPVPANPRTKARQLIGQPAGPGLAQGPARVITSFQDLARFAHGEVLVCDAVDPNMTFVIALAAAVVERRGGMLIHGAIIAREYGLPCVTGVPEATALIHTGDALTVDGYLGLVIID